MMLNKQKERIETGPSLKDEKQRLKTLNEFLEKSIFISGKTKENSAKSQVFLNRFSEELDPILKKSFELKNNCVLIDQALSNAKSKLEYLQNAKALERKLSQKVQKDDLASFLAAMDKGIIIFEFTKAEKHTNEYHAEINDKMEKALEFATQQLTTLFAESVIDLIENNEKGTVEALTLMDQYFHKLRNLDHFDTYVNTRDKEFSRRIREIINMSEGTLEESYKKGSHPALNGILTFINSLKQGKMEVYKIFSSADANLVYQNLVNSLYRTFVELCDSLLGTKSTFDSNSQFFASLDFLERLLANSEQLQSTMGGYYSAIEDIIDRFSSSVRNFIKNYSRYMADENKRPDNEQISHITYKAISLILQLQEYHKVLSNLKIEAEISGAIVKSVVKLLEENRSFFKTKNPMVPILYILNNLFYMISQTKNEDSDVIVDYASKDMMDELFEKHVEEYLLLTWNNVEDILSSDVQVAYEKSGKIKTSTKKAIKKKFSDLNRRVEEFRKIHKDMWFVNKEFVETLQRKNKKHVLPKYQSFYNTYGEVSFTKNRDKYVKYTLSQLSNAIDETITYNPSYGR